jgi:glycerol-3-phosphate dehydrogenase
LLLGGVTFGPFGSSETTSSLTMKGGKLVTSRKLFEIPCWTIVRQHGINAWGQSSVHLPKKGSFLKVLARVGEEIKYFVLIMSIC